MANEDSLAINLGSLLTEKKLTREDWVPQLSGLVSGFKVHPPKLFPYDGLSPLHVDSRSTIQLHIQGQEFLCF